MLRWPTIFASSMVLKSDVNNADDGNMNAQMLCARSNVGLLCKTRAHSTNNENILSDI